MRIIEAWCPKCEIVFNPHSEEEADLEHFLCGTMGELLGVWVHGERYDTALIDLAGIGPAVWGQFPVDHRWNGWLCPHIDALSAVTILDSINEAPEGELYGSDYDFREDGALVVTDRQWRDEDPEGYQPEVLLPDEDGLYDLGSYSWVWSYADWNADPRH